MINNKKKLKLQNLNRFKLVIKVNLIFMQVEEVINNNSLIMIMMIMMILNNLVLFLKI